MRSKPIRRATNCGRSFLPAALAMGCGQRGQMDGSASDANQSFAICDLDGLVTAMVSADISIIEQFLIVALVSREARLGVMIG